MDIHDYLRALRRNLVVIVALSLIGLCAATAVVLITPPRYESSTQLYVSVQSGSDTTSDLSLGRSYVQQTVSSYATLVSSTVVLQPVIDDLGLNTTAEQLASRVSASSAPNDVTLTLSVTDRSPSQAARLATALADSFRTVITGEIERYNDNLPSPIRIDVVQPAQVPIEPAAPNTPLWIAIGAGIGFAIGVVVALARSMLDARVHGIRDVERATTTPVIGAVPFDGDASVRPLAIATAPQSPAAEAYRALRTNMQFLAVDGRPAVYTVTSAGPGEGKTTTAANLAIAIAEAGKRVILIDGDMRLPRVAERFGIEGGVGLSDVLAGRIRASDAIQRWGHGALFVLPAGTRPPNPAELLGSTTMRQLIDDISSTFDVAIIDAPPVLLVTDAAVLASRSAGALIVVAGGKTTVPRLTAAVDSIEKVGATVLGTVLTMLPMTGSDRTAYGAYSTPADRTRDTT